VLYAPGDVRVEDRPDPKIEKPTDAILRVSAACVCGSDLWPYRGTDPVDEPRPMGHEYVGVVEEVGADVTSIKPGQFVVGSFFASDNTCEICQAGYQSRCAIGEFATPTGAQAQYVRIPLADGTLVATPAMPDAEPARRVRRARDRLVRGGRRRSCTGQDRRRRRRRRRRTARRPRGQAARRRTHCHLQP
jgi:threonine dehydrogenase-like Zn-dependent dehydrogenase